MMAGLRMMAGLWMVARLRMVAGLRMVFLWWISLSETRFFSFVHIQTLRKCDWRVRNWAVTADSKFDLRPGERQVVGLDRQDTCGLIEAENEVLSRPLAEQAAADWAARLSVVNMRVNEQGTWSKCVLEGCRISFLQEEDVVLTNGSVFAHAAEWIEIRAVVALAVAINEASVRNARGAGVSSSAFLTSFWAV